MLSKAWQIGLKDYHITGVALYSNYALQHRAIADGFTLCQRPEFLGPRQRCKALDERGCLGEVLSKGTSCVCQLNIAAKLLSNLPF